MKPKHLGRLQQVADAVYQHEQRAIKAICAEETALRRALAALDAGGAEFAPADIGKTGALALSGAEMAWRKWSGNRRAALNAELARVLARKSQELTRVRQAFGRSEAIRMLHGNRPGKGHQPG